MQDEHARFLRSLAETIAWCGDRADPARPRDSLRDNVLRPASLTWFGDTESRRAAVAELVRRRSRDLHGLLATPRTVIDPRPSDLAGGRLLIYFPEAQLYDGAAELASGGFFDVDNEPAWDTWVWLCSRRDGDWQPGPADGWQYAPGDPIHTGYDEYLVAWIPPAFLEIAERGIQVNPEACIVWASVSLT